jgi:hypothetical protein
MGYKTEKKKKEFSNRQRGRSVNRALSDEIKKTNI